jgi:hypothetical protein
MLSERVRDEKEKPTMNRIIEKKKKNLCTTTIKVLEKQW